MSNDVDQAQSDPVIQAQLDPFLAKIGLVPFRYSATLIKDNI